MANTYSKIFLHIVFAVKNRQSLLTPQIKDPVFKYMTGIVTKHEQKLLIINGHLDHVHMLISCKTTLRLDEMMKEVKEHSSKFINSNRMVFGRFAWQSGYAAFSVSRWDQDMIFNYIRNQEEHHSKQSFREEYLELLKRNDVEYDPAYVFYDPNEVD